MTPPIREELPARRQTARHTIKLGPNQVKMYVDVGFYADGRPGEVFIVMNQTGSDERAWIDSKGRDVSHMLQYGIPLAEIVEMNLGAKFEPAGMVVGDARIKMASSPLDYLARLLGVYYAGREDLAHVPAAESP